MGGTLRALTATATLLSAGLCAVYILAGAMKLTPRLDADAHGRMLADAPRWLRALHLDATPISPDVLRVFIAVSEIALALALMTNYAADAALLLVALMLCAAYTHFRLEQTALPPLVFAGALVVLRVLLRLEDIERAKVAAAADKDL